MVEPIADEVWGVPGEARMPAGARLPLRMTVIRLPDGGLWLHSPVRLDDEVAAELEALGPVRHLVAPSLVHHLFAGRAKERWPEATLWGPRALPAKTGAALDAELAPGSEAWGGAITALPIEGAPRLDEFCFVHHPSRTLLVTDLVFHVLQAPNWATATLLRMTGSYGGLAASRAWRWVFAQDRAAVGRSVVRILEQDFDRLVPCHGEVVDTGAHAALTEAAAALTAWSR